MAILDAARQICLPSNRLNDMIMLHNQDIRFNKTSNPGNIWLKRAIVLKLAYEMAFYKVMFIFYLVFPFAFIAPHVLHFFSFSFDEKRELLVRFLYLSLLSLTSLWYPYALMRKLGINNFVETFNGLCIRFYFLFTLLLDAICT